MAAHLKLSTKQFKSMVTNLHDASEFLRLVADICAAAETRILVAAGAAEEASKPTSRVI
jgi:hypothetical protein